MAVDSEIGTTAFVLNSITYSEGRQKICVQMGRSYEGKNLFSMSPFCGQMSELFILLSNLFSALVEAVIDLSRIEHNILYSAGVTYLEVIENGPTFHTSVCFSQKDGFCNTDSTFKEVNE